MAKRDRGGATPPPAAPRLTKRQQSRAERERQQRTVLYVVMGGAALVILALFAFAALREQVFLPREAVATVNGAPITRETYWKARRLEIGRQLQQLQFQSQMGGQNAQFMQQRAEALQKDLRNVRNAPVDVPTLEQLATNEVLKQRAPSLGVDVSADKIAAEVERQFAPPPATSTPVSTVEATQTAAAATAVATLTPQPTLAPTQAPVTGTVSPTSSPTFGPTATGTPFRTATPTVPPTPMNEAARATANANFRDQTAALRQSYGMTPDDYRELVVRPRLLADAVKAKLGEQTPADQPQVRAAHILVASEEAARAIKAEIEQGADFATLARDRSSDSGSKDKGGDLDWFPRGIMAPEFERAAFQQPVGVIGEPVKTQFGWHVIKVLETAENRPVAPNLLDQVRSTAYDNWLKEQRASSTVTSVVSLPAFSPTPTPGPDLIDDLDGTPAP